VAAVPRANHGGGSIGDLAEQGTCWPAIHGGGQGCQAPFTRAQICRHQPLATASFAGFTSERVMNGLIAVSATRS